MSKRSLFEGKSTKLSQRDPTPSTEDTKKSIQRSFGTDDKKYVRATFTLEESDINWLTQAVREYKKSSLRNISKSELIRIGIHLMKDKDLREILREIT
ncbi:hypothetical protein ACFL4G_07910 [Thermodesulfobacteriota bacterium]